MKHGVCGNQQQRCVIVDGCVVCSGERFKAIMLALSIPIWICVMLIVVSGIVQAWLLLRCSWQLPPPTGKHALSLNRIRGLYLHQ